MSSRISSIPVDTGLYVLRYIGAGNRRTSPSVLVRPAETSQDGIDLVSAPHVDQGVLGEPGSCLIVRATRSGSLDVFVTGRGAAGDSAELRLDLLSGPTQPALATWSAGKASDPTIRLVGHVSRRGDVIAGPEGWIAGPDAPARIEGISLQLSGAEGGIEYQVLLGGPGGSWTDWVSDGDYAGTRGQHRALVGLRARLTGEIAKRQDLRVEALFLGSPVRMSNGPAIDLSSDADIDPLVGIKIATIAKDAAVSSIQQSSAPNPSSLREQGAGRVRVFRASNSR